MEKVSWTDRVTIEEVLHRNKEEKIILHTLEYRQCTYNVALRRVLTVYL